jgi:hypothetical protein
VDYVSHRSLVPEQKPSRNLHGKNEEKFLPLMINRLVLIINTDEILKNADHRSSSLASDNPGFYIDQALFDPTLLTSETKTSVHAYN